MTFANATRDQQGDNVLDRDVVKFVLFVAYSFVLNRFYETRMDIMKYLHKSV